LLVNQEQPASERPTGQLVDFGQRVALKPPAVRRHSLPGASSR
jgi:hypothetical protein